MPINKDRARRTQRTQGTLKTQHNASLWITQNTMKLPQNEFASLTTRFEKSKSEKQERFLSRQMQGEGHRKPATRLSIPRHPRSKIKSV